MILYLTFIFFPKMPLPQSFPGLNPPKNSLGECVIINISIAFVTGQM